MSQYMSFYIKSKKGEFVPIGTFCRVDARYQALADEFSGMYGKNTPLTKEDINVIILNMQDMISSSKARISDLEDYIYEIGQFNSPMEEKLEAIQDVHSEIYAIKENIDDYERALSWYGSLYGIIIEAEETKYYSNEEMRYDPDDFIWLSWESDEYINKDFFDNCFD